MNELRFGLEVLTVGFGVVVVTLFLLALILVCFSKFLAPRKQEILGTTHQPPENARKETAKDDRAAGPPAALADEAQEPAGESLPEAETDVQPELVAAIAGAVYAEETSTSRPEVVAAIAGAMHYLFDLTTSPGEVQPTVPGEVNLWAETGRTRLMQIRQEFVLLRRGIIR